MCQFLMSALWVRWSKFLTFQAVLQCHLIKVCGLHYNDYRRLDYKNSYSDARDASIPADEFGNTSSVEIFDLRGIFPYFYSFVKFFEDRGYIKNININFEQLHMIGG